MSQDQQTERNENGVSLYDLSQRFLNDLEFFKPYFNGEEPNSVRLTDYQRGYCWNEVTANSFITGFLSSKDSLESQIGTLVLLIEKNSQKIEIVDGQQRLLSLLIALEVFGQKPEKNSFLGLLKQRLKEADLPSLIQIHKNYLFLKSSPEISKESASVFTPDKIKVSFFVFDDKKRALEYYKRSNALGVKLSPGQLLKALHYSDVLNESNNYWKNLGHPKPSYDLRYAIEAWRLNYLRKSTSFEDYRESPIDPEGQKLRKELSSQTVSGDSESPGAFVHPPKYEKRKLRKYTVENFIANSNWDDAFYGFEGFFNTFQQVIFGGRNRHNSELAVPVFDEFWQNIPLGLQRLQNSEADLFEDLSCNRSKEEALKGKDLLRSVFAIRPGCSFFQTAKDLLKYHQDFINFFNKSFQDLEKDSEKVHELPKDWIGLTFEAILEFKTDYLTSRKLRWPTEKNNGSFCYILINSGMLLCILCIALLFELRFAIGASKNDVQTLKKNVQTLENDVQTLKNNVQPLKNNVQTLKNDVQTLKKNVQTLKKNVQTLENNVQTLENNVQTLENNVQTLENDVQTLEKQAKYKSLLHEILWSSLHGDLHRWDKVVPNSGVYEAGPIIVLSPTFSIAVKRLSAAVITNNGSLKSFIKEIRTKADPEKGPLKTLKTLW